MKRGKSSSPCWRKSLQYGMSQIQPIDSQGCSLQMLIKCDLHWRNGCFCLQGSSWSSLEGCQDKPKTLILNHLQLVYKTLLPLSCIPHWSSIKYLRLQCTDVQ